MSDFLKMKPTCIKCTHTCLYGFQSCEFHYNLEIKTVL